MYGYTVKEPCPLNGARFAERTLDVQTFPEGAVTDVSELVEGSKYRLHYCINHSASATLPPQEQKWDHVMGPLMTFRGFDSQGTPLFDTEGMCKKCPHDLSGVVSPLDSKKEWSHYCGLIPV